MRQSLAELMASPSSSSGGDPAVSLSEASCMEADEGLFPPEMELGLDLDDWLEAAMAESSELEAHPHPHPSRTSNRLKAAAAARLNRQKKKQYVLGLESRLQGLAAENRLLRDRNRGLCRRLRDLERETGYLRAVLANQSALGRLLTRLAGVSFSSSLIAQEGRLPEPLAWEGSSGSTDHDYALPVPEDEEEGEENHNSQNNNNKRVASPSSSSLLSSSRSSSSPGGICLHVDRDQISVEFCSLCARRAAATTSASSSSTSFASKIFSFRCLPCQAPLCRG